MNAVGGPFGHDLHRGDSMIKSVVSIVRAYALLLLHAVLPNAPYVSVRVRFIRQAVVFIHVCEEGNEAGVGVIPHAFAAFRHLVPIYPPERPRHSFLICPVRQAKAALVDEMRLRDAALRPGVGFFHHAYRIS